MTPTPTPTPTTTRTAPTVRIQTKDKPPTGLEVLIRFVSPDKRDKSLLLSEVGDLQFKQGSGSKTPGRLTVSLGSPSSCTTEKIRQAAGMTVRWLQAHRVRRAGLKVSEFPSPRQDGFLEAVCEGWVLGSFRFDLHKTKGQKISVPTISVIGAKLNPEDKRSIRREVNLCEAVNLARSWGHEPPNIINPVTLAERLLQLAKQTGLTCRVYDEKQLASMKAEALLQVGVASKTPSRLIILEYKGNGDSKNAKPVVLVGKAVTFDTGGYSLKNTENIVGMKYDKCGAMAVIGVMKAVAALQPRTPVVGIIAAAENMISGEAYRPNDIIKTMSGQTVEIISTDAEGRLVLADALTFAQQNYKPHSIIDLATLTGGVVVALGSVRAGMMANDDDLAAQLSQAGDRVHERLWRLPLDDDYRDLIKGDDSDLKNSGGRQAHPIIGGIFLKQFVNDKVPWAHLDIAGTATCDKDLPYCPKGATGFGVRLLMDYIESL